MNYLTVAEYKASPTSVDTSTLVAGGNQDAQDAELYRRIGMASGWVDNFCNQPVGAAVRREIGSTRVRRDGMLALHPGPFPLIALLTLSTGPQANQLTVVSDLTGVWIQEASFVVPTAPLVSSIGPLQLGTPMPGGRLLANYTYTSGYPVTTLAATATAAATTLQVVSTVGFVTGQPVIIEDGALAEQVVVSAVPDGTHLSVSATSSTHTFVAGVASQIGVHAMPLDLKVGVVFVTTALIRSRGNDALVMGQSLQPGTPPGMNPVTSNDLKLAREILFGYRRLA